ncbi:MAG TPA: DUF6134 family protein [Gemmatimonadaceae bacterium]
MNPAVEAGYIQAMPSFRSALSLPVVSVYAVASLVLATSPARAQGRIVDEGTFILSGAGTAGTEHFRVVSGVEPGMLRATAQLSVGDQRLASSLTADSLGTPSLYELTTPALHVRAHARPGRLSALSSDAQGNESMKEYVVTPGSTVILDERLFNQYYLVALSRRTGTLTVISPGTGRTTTESLAARGMESIQVGGRAVTAAHFTLSGNGGRRDFWLDANGRVLKVQLPSGLSATREELPR